MTINVEDNEKLRATVAYNEVYITEIEEEKKQVEEEKRKVEEQYLKEKQITKGHHLPCVQCAYYMKNIPF